jgi:hypothetical protein
MKIKVSRNNQKTAKVLKNQLKKETTACNFKKKLVLKRRKKLQRMIF